MRSTDGLIVADDFVDFVGEKIAHGALDEIGLFEDARGRGELLDLLLDARPLLEEKTEVAHEIAGALAFPDGANDDADALGNFEFAQNFAQPDALFWRLDFARNAAAIAVGHEDEIASGETEIGGNARAFRADRAFRHLHDDFGADGIDARNILRGEALFRLLAIAAFDLFDAAVEGRGNGIPEMEKGVFLEADVDKHRLQSGLDVFDPPFVNAARDVAVALALDAIFFELSVLEQGDAPFEFLDGDDEFVAGLATRQSENFFHFFYHGAAKLLKSLRDSGVDFYHRPTGRARRAGIGVGAGRGWLPNMRSKKLRGRRGAGGATGTARGARFGRLTFFTLPRASASGSTSGESPGCAICVFLAAGFPLASSSSLSFDGTISSL